MNPKIWGPSAWFFLHCVTLSYPSNPTAEDKMNYKNFFTYLGKVLPCYNCQENYKKHLDEIKLDDCSLKSRQSLVEWLYKIHNSVNKTTGKKTYNYEDFINNYNKDIRNSNKSNNNFRYYMLSLSLILILLAVLFNSYLVYKQSIG